MKFGTVPGVKKQISRIIQGSMGANHEILDAVFERGCNAVDTATVYGNEGMVGDWVSSRGVREEFVILTKGAHHNGDVHRVNPECITADLTKSLALLKTDYIDLYGLHRDDPRVPVDEIVDCLHQHQQAGRIHAFGGSNWHVDRIREANEWAAANGKTGFAFSSPNFSLAEQYDEPWPRCTSISGPEFAADRQWYREQQLPLFTWSSMAGGFWSGRFGREQYQTAADEIPELVRRCYCGDSNFDRLDRAAQLSEAKGVTVPQIANAYLFHCGLNVFALIASLTAAEFEENVKALDIVLTDDEAAWLDLRKG